MASKEAESYWNLPPKDENNEDLGSEFTELKKAIIAQFGREHIRANWLQVTRLLVEENNRIAEARSRAWPEVEFADIAAGTVSKEQLKAIKHSGIIVIRNVLPKEQAKGLLTALEAYLEQNKGSILCEYDSQTSCQYVEDNLMIAYPEENPWAYRTFFSPVQNTVRSHPNSLKAQHFLNNLWTGYTDSNTSSVETSASPFPLSYADGLRHRRPGGFSATVRPHIDAGSLDRWGDDTYRRYYERIFGSGDVLTHDPWDVTYRIRAETAKYPGWQQSTVFRAFQGWTSLSHSGGGFNKGALAVYPSVKLGIAYVLLRPFFRPPVNNPDTLEGEVWEWDDDTPGFPGAFRGQSQQLSPSTHPHLELSRTLTVTPQIRPGDAVFWHSDVVHAVDPLLDDNGGESATVLYIPAVPLTQTNLRYIKEQRDAILHRGETPPDFARQQKTYEEGLVGWHGVSDVANVEAQQALGLAKLPGESALFEWANDILGHA
ncbi:hypothetical protein F503_02304 [Ophiostoma piceae UAMH 11346]|uniref:Duf1479 domain protein n=1 Tax=Ophiostoma piceae (strain UAMH 11346) TaxID=1262450 RepID=S3CXI1_OPHP1|nr:hypothetical protein F503_02304 [Ophiostoma piceae UAMH 11346]